MLILCIIVFLIHLYSVILKESYSSDDAVTEIALTQLNAY